MSQDKIVYVSHHRFSVSPQTDLKTVADPGWGMGPQTYLTLVAFGHILFPPPPSLDVLDPPLILSQSGDLNKLLLDNTCIYNYIFQFSLNFPYITIHIATMFYLLTIFLN